MGMTITSKHLGRHAITIQYPEEKFEMPERSRGMVVLLSDKNTGNLNCTGCLLCMKACPTAAIRVDAPRGEDKKRVLKSFTLDNGLCCFCGLCEEACNFCAIKLTPKYEYSTLDKDELFWDMKKLQELGSDVDYIDTRKKKPIKKKIEKPAGDAPKAEAPADSPKEPTPAPNPSGPEAPGEIRPAEERQETPKESSTPEGDKGEPEK